MTAETRPLDTSPPSRTTSALVLHNPKAGDGNWPRERLDAALAAAGFAAAFLDVKQDDISSIAGRRPGLFIVAGGDGTVAKTAPHLPRGAQVAILPLGTANNIACAHGIAGDPASLIAGLHRARRRPLPLLSVEGPWGRRVCTDGAGLGALAPTLEMKPGPGDTKIGAGRRALVRVLADLPPRTLHWHQDGTGRVADLLMFEVLAQGRSGPALPLASRPAAPGLMTLYLAGPDDRDALGRWIDGGARGPAPGRVETAREIEVVWDGEMPLRIEDDQQPDPADPVQITWRGLDHDLTLLIPDGAIHDDP